MNPLTILTWDLTLGCFKAAWTKESIDSSCFHKQTKSCEAPQPLQPWAAAAAREINIKPCQSSSLWCIITHKNIWNAEQQISAKSQWLDSIVLCYSFFTYIFSTAPNPPHSWSTLLTSLWVVRGWGRSECSELRAPPLLALNRLRSELSAGLLFNPKDWEHLLHVRLAVSLVSCMYSINDLQNIFRSSGREGGEQREERWDWLCFLCV